MDIGEFPIAGDQVRAEIARVTAPAPVSASDDLFVIVNSFDGGRGEHGPCLWEPPAGALPAVGELCVVVRAIEEDGEGEQTIVIAFDRNDSAATDADLAAHVVDTTAVHGIPNTAALVVDGDPAGGDLAGTYPNPTLGGTYKTAFPFAAGWADIGGFDAASYSRIGRLVVLHGVVTKTTGLPAAGNVIGTLPAGFRPAGTLAFAQGLQDGFSANRIDVLANGNVVWQSGGTSETDYAVLNGISFITA